MKPIAYYQNITGHKKEHKNRIGSAYWNEGKWKHYIKPFLPEDNRKDMTFVEIGCNNGLFLKLAKNVGFRNVYGIEKDKGAYSRGIEHRNSTGMDYKMLNREVGKDFDFNELPIADIYLLSNVHYYFDLNDWLNFLDRLKHRTVHCLIITRPYRTKDHWRPKTSIKDTKYYFKDWQKIGARYRLRYGYAEPKDDPSPRVLWSLLFKSDLRRIKFEDLKTGAPADTVKIPRNELVKDVSQKDSIDIKKTSYFKAWKDRMSAHWSDDRIYGFVKEKVDLMYDIRENGQKEPIIVQMDDKIIDGGHRVAILKELGHKSIIARTI